MPESGFGMLNIDSRAAPTTAVYINKSSQYALEEMLRLAFLVPLHKQGHCRGTEISSSQSLRQAAHKTMNGAILQVGFALRTAGPTCWAQTSWQKETKLWNLKVCCMPPHWPLLHHSCGVSSGFTNSRFGLIEVRLQEMGHLLLQHILWLR